MPRKRLIVCCDGTWNEPVSRTNIWRIKNAIATRDERGDEPIMQWVYYDSGVGTGRFDRISGGLLGRGLSKNVKQAYEFLVENYASGDEIWCFGFSRGAYTVRSLCGMLGVSGLLRHRDIGFIEQAFDYYRTPEAERDKTDYHQIRDDLHLRTVDPDPKRRQAGEGLLVQFLGVFDTVGSLGVPMPWLKKLTQWRSVSFHDTGLSPLLVNAYQALAIDERRGPFAPTLWTAEPTAGQIVSQVWFPGVHSVVGGGYEDKRCGNVVLQWMLDAAWTAGLQLRERYVEREVKPDPFGPLHDSMTRGWQIVNWLPGIAEAGPRPIGRKQREAAGAQQVSQQTEYLHWTVEARIAEGRLAAPYRPSNLCDDQGDLINGVGPNDIRRENRRAARRTLREACMVDNEPSELLDLSRLGARLRLSSPPANSAARDSRPLRVASPSVGERDAAIAWRNGQEFGVAFTDAA